MAESSGSQSVFSGLQKPLVVADGSMIHRLLDTMVADSN